jgi:hypothetical protein
MWLGPGTEPDSSLPDLDPGDRLRVLAEIEVTTDCEHPGEGCHRRAYSYAPEVEAQLLLAADPKLTERAKGEAVAIGKAKVQPCTHRRHHQVLVLDETLDVRTRTIAWTGPSYVSLVLGASSPKAEAGQFLLVGQNEPDGTVKGDMGGIRVVRLRPGAQAAPPPAQTESLEVNRVPIEKGLRTVVYSLELRDLRKGEQLEVRSRLVTSAGGLPEKARISTRLVLADGRGDGDPGEHAKKVASFNGHVSKLNGFNCLPEEEHSITEKVGVVRIKRSARRPLYLNLVAVSASPEHGIPPGSALKVVDDGYVRALRYPAELAG